MINVKHKIRITVDALIISLTLLGLIFSMYNALGEPLTLHHAIYRVFNDRITYYRLSNKKLTIVTDNYGWGGSGWSKNNAIQDGKRQIKKLMSVLPDFSGQVDQVEITVTYLKNPVVTSSYAMNN